MKLQRYWFEFDLSRDDKPPAGIFFGCGVTAFTLDDAVILMKEKVFSGRPLPKICRTVEDVDVSTLEENHVRPNMGVVIYRGVWYPLGYDY